MVTQVAVLTLILSGMSFSMNGAFAAEEEVEAMHGIRNEKCAGTEEDAKNRVFEALQSGKGLCPDGVKANQVDGWTCRKGYDCKKNQVRCNTQYKCGGLAVSIPVEVRDPVMPKPMGIPSLGSLGGGAAGSTLGSSSTHSPIGSIPTAVPSNSPAAAPNMKPISSTAPKFALPTPTATGTAGPWPTVTVVPSTLPAELSKVLPFPIPTVLSTSHPADNIR